MSLLQVLNTKMRWHQIFLYSGKTRIINRQQEEMGRASGSMVTPTSVKGCLVSGDLFRLIRR